MPPMPVFVTVTVCAAPVVPTVCDPKSIDNGDTDATGWMPLPDNATESGDDVALLGMLSDAPSAPVTPGANVTPTVQPAGGTRCAPEQRLLDREKAPGLAPVSESVPTSIADVPLLVTVTVCAELAVPTRRSPKFKLAGLTLTEKLFAATTVRLTVTV